MNKLYYLIIIFIIIFIQLYLYTIICNCNNNNKDKGYCYRYEYKGVLISKILLLFILGLLFSEYYLIIFSIFILWDIFEMYLDYNDNIVLKYGGCLDKDIYNKEYIVGYNEEKYLNSIDKFFNIKNSKKHMWHGSISEIIYGIIFFILGYLSKFTINIR